MAEKSGYDLPAWEPSPFALSVVRRPDPAGEGPTAVSLGHPGTPFFGIVEESEDGGGLYETRVRVLILDYLRKANAFAKLQLPQEWLLSLERQIEGYCPEVTEVDLAWLPLAERARAHPFSSFWFERRVADDLIETTLVVSASLSLLIPVGGQVEVHPLGSELGIRVVAHIRRPGGTRNDEFRITSMSASLPAKSAAATARLGALDQLVLQRSLAGHIARITELLAFRAGSAHIRGIRFSEPETEGTVELYGVGLRASESDSEAGATFYAYLADTSLADLIEGAPPRLLRTVPLVADADCGGQAGQARIFRQDPLSQAPLPHAWQARPHSLGERRPTRSENTLDRYRRCEEIVAGSHYPLQHDPGLMRVMRTPFVREDHPHLGQVKRVHLPALGSSEVPRLRSNDFSAVNGLHNPRQLFKRFEKYLIDPVGYFRSAQLPFDVYYRYGQSVNASVRVVGWDRAQVGPLPDAAPPKLALHLGLASPSHRARVPWDGANRAPAEYLGIAADERWMWHELGHVLLMATTGELEMRFAHSPGDALAAIACDPRSDLATPARRPWRGATFPWVFIPRRHDRCVRHGWSWSGGLHRALREVPDIERRRYKGYWSEQILSSSLFRLYLCLGGDTVLRGTATPDEVTRCAAAHYAVFLIMKGLFLLGDARIVPANDPDQLVSALIDADSGTQVFTLCDPCDYGNNNLEVRRVGGCAHKAIRWAFEAQGLYAGNVAENNAPGNPPEVDIYIEDRRPTAETWGHCAVEHGPGSYVPVSLEVPRSEDDNDPPDWFAAEHAIAVQDDPMDAQGKLIFVTVSNRGSQTAEAVTVTVFVSEWAAGSQPADWLEPARWSGIPAGIAPQDIEPGAEAQFGPLQWQPASGTHYLVLAQATCAADRANTDVLSGLPCSLQRTPLVDLVANDNNVGVRSWQPPA